MRCTHCREEFEGESVRYKGRDYCCQACAFEASLRTGSICGSRSSVEAGMRYARTQDHGMVCDDQPKPARVIAIDGPVAVGKTSVGRLLAQRLGYRFIDTGAMYRALTWKALQLGIDTQDERRLPQLADEVDIEVQSDTGEPNGYRALVDGRDVALEIRSTEVEATVSLVSRIPEVRRKMVAKQRALAQQGRAVVVGRDIATVVLPQAELKIFLVATPEQRALRRYRELAESGKGADYDAVLRDLQARDGIDSTRGDSPLKPDADSRVIDTTELTLEQVVDRIYALARDDRCL
ncbi:MAG: (d)CMP kinase [Chloroflexota bacterium]